MFPLPQETMTPKPTGPPDGGWGWVVAAAGFAVNGLSYGVLRSLGLAFPDFAEYFDRNAQETAAPRWEAGTGVGGSAVRAVVEDTVTKQPKKSRPLEFDLQT